MPPPVTESYSTFTAHPAPVNASTLDVWPSQLSARFRHFRTCQMSSQVPPHVLPCPSRNLVAPRSTLPTLFLVGASLVGALPHPTHPHPAQVRSPYPMVLPSCPNTMYSYHVLPTPHILRPNEKPCVPESKNPSSTS